MTDKELLEKAKARHEFIRMSPCVSQGQMECRDCLKEACNMEADRSIHQELFIAGWLCRGRQE